MHVLITGATGFIASQIVTDLLAAGHSVTCCVRDPVYAKRLFPNAEVIACDFVRDTTPTIWLSRLRNIDVVVNCVGILHHPRSKIVWAIHYDTPKALFNACVTAGVKKIIQISALGIETAAVDYAKSKKAADDFLQTLPITSVILRPSLVYGRGSYGGTSLFRGLAGLPWVTPVPGKGQQTFQPIHLEDLSRAVQQLIEKPVQHSLLLNAVSEQRVTLNEILMTLRRWLGFATSKMIFIPLNLIKLGAYLGNLLPNSAMNMTSYSMLIQNNISNEDAAKQFQDTIGFVPDSFKAGVIRQPSTVQDRWHAKLFFLKPLLQFCLAFIWIWTGLCSVFFSSKISSYQLLAEAGIHSFWQPILLYGAGCLDFILGIALLFNYQIKKTCSIQIGIMLFYTAFITWKLPSYWLDPFAPIAKNIPLLVSTLIFLALESDR